MASNTKVTGLGRGLSALLGEDDAGTSASGTSERRPTLLPIEQITPNPQQPRSRFDEDKIEDLARSISEKGLIQPILVRRARDGDQYQIVAGERRWRAAQRAGLHNVPVVVRDYSDTEALEISIVENVQRQDLTPVEEARGYRQLIDDFNRTQDQVAAMVGKSRSHVANMVRLLLLPDAVLEMLDSGKLSAGHARALIGAENPGFLARKVVTRSLNVRQTERLAQQGAAKRAPQAARGGAKSPDTLALERSIEEQLGLSVDIRHNADGSGEVRLQYRSLDQLDEVCERLTQPGAGAAKAS